VNAERLARHKFQEKRGTVSKKSFRFILVICAFLLGNGSLTAQAIFQSNFDSEPLGPLGARPNIVIIRDGDARVDVIGPAFGFATQSLLIDGTPHNLAGVAFYNPSQLFSGKAIIE